MNLGNNVNLYKFILAMKTFKGLEHRTEINRGNTAI